MRACSVFLEGQGLPSSMKRLVGNCGKSPIRKEKVPFSADGKYDERRSYQREHLFQNDEKISRKRDILIDVCENGLAKLF